MESGAVNIPKFHLIFNGLLRLSYEIVGKYYGYGRSEKRSEIMSHIRGKNTKPELLIRSLLHRSGFRFRIHRRDLPGNPDIVLPKYKTVIFVHGCFGINIPVANKPTSLKAILSIGD